ncbi:MAG: DNA-binding protein [Marinomonas sp.]|nr:DNA-binding protein [Marinomonas sp.]
MNNDELLSRKQAAEFLCVKPQTLATWACTGRYDLTFVKVGRKVLYRKKDLESFLNRHVYTKTF